MYKIELTEDELISLICAVAHAIDTISVETGSEKYQRIFNNLVRHLIFK